VAGGHRFVDLPIASFVSFFFFGYVSAVAPSLFFVPSLVWCGCLVYKAGRKPISREKLKRINA
jgi:hypothetical protein